MADAKQIREKNKLDFFQDYLQSLGLPADQNNQYTFTQTGKDGEAHTKYQIDGKVNGHDLSVVFDEGNYPSGRYNVKAYVDGDMVTAPVKGEHRDSGYLGIITPTPGIKHYLSPRGHDTLALLQKMLAEPAGNDPSATQPDTQTPQPVEQPVPQQPAQEAKHAPARPAAPAHDAGYVKDCCDWLGAKGIEDTRKKAYYDSVSNVTVGIGFNMDAPGAKSEWKTAFAALPPDQRPDFDRIYSGAKLKKHELAQADQLLNPEQIHTLAIETVQRRERKLKRAYGSTWNKLSDDQKVAISSAFFTNEANVVTNNHFFADMKAYGEAKTPAEKQNFLNFAAYELAFNTQSDPNRRREEAKKLLGISGQPDANEKLDAIQADQQVVDYINRKTNRQSRANTIDDGMRLALSDYHGGKYKDEIGGKPIVGSGLPDPVRTV